jgi:hypothetical protein
VRDLETVKRFHVERKLGGGAMRCDPNVQSAENHKSVMAVTAAQSGSVPFLPPTSQQLE